jgi:Haloacid Dehalogenase superfamily, subfamily IB, phosphoserine phosphatase-like
MPEWRNHFSRIYRLVKSYCSISDNTVAEALHVSVSAVRQYASSRQSMPDDIDALCVLFIKEIEILNGTTQKRLLADVHRNYDKTNETVHPNETGEYITTILRQCHANEKAHLLHPRNSIVLHKATGHIQAVVFDFDGTLTRRGSMKPRTTWEALWVMLGYSVDDCYNLHKQFDAGEFDHQTWCNITAKQFMERGLSRQQVLSLAKKTKLIHGCTETLKKIRERNIKIYIVSGSIKEIIENVLGSAHGYFTEIKANEFIFNRESSILEKIIGTKYDFRGKANYINYIANRLQIATSDILFVGNSNNDIWAHESGANTLCINPTLTNPHDNIVWHNSIMDCKNLSAILPFVT